MILRILEVVFMAWCTLSVIGLIVLAVAGALSSARECNHCGRIFEPDADEWLCPKCRHIRNHKPVRPALPAGHARF